MNFKKNWYWFLLGVLAIGLLVYFSFFYNPLPMPPALPI
jgi:hypothetical protein